MIYIEKNKVNEVVLTLSEKSSLIDPYYLFTFQNEFNVGANLIVYSQDDISSSTDRYNLFLIEENNSGSTSGGTGVVLSLVEGQYNYKVYESTTPTLDINDTTGIIIENGRMVVNDPNNLSSSQNQVIPSQNNTAYNPYS
jgi:hypothetical protein